MDIYSSRRYTAVTTVEPLLMCILMRISTNTRPSFPSQSLKKKRRRKFNNEC